ncbi:HNH endonuclease [Candidatus Dojkabacteria bacterium]|jgi:hypothetical protein|nr:HNH endonuclease [Candidatus Dojkabacteria bacterium]
MEIFTKLCVACGKELKKRQNKFCSKQCNGICQRNKILVHCGICKKEFFTVNGRIRDKRGKYCSKACYYISRKGINVSKNTEFKKGLIPWNKGSHIMTNDALIRWRKNNPSPFKGWKHSEKTKELIRLKRANQKNPSGSNHWNWKGGTSPLRKSIQNTRKYRNWRTAVFKRDDYTCQFCKERGHQINADHIKPFYKIIEKYKINTVEKAKNCKELWDISNGRTLCVPCHKQTPSYLVNQYTK